MKTGLGSRQVPCAVALLVLGACGSERGQASSDGASAGAGGAATAGAGGAGGGGSGGLGGRGGSAGGGSGGNAGGGSGGSAGGGSGGSAGGSGGSGGALGGSGGSAGGSGAGSTGAAGSGSAGSSDAGGGPDAASDGGRELDASDGGADGPPGSEPYQVAWAPANVCAWKSTGSLYCWGANKGGQLGVGHEFSVSHPVEVMGLGDVKKVGCGLENPDVGGHTCAIDSGGRLWCWGSNDSGQLGVGAGDFTNRSLPTLVSGLSGVVDVGLGDAHTCALDGEGAVWCWGEPSAYQLGVREPGPQELPERVVTPHDAVELAVGPEFNCLRTAGGEVRCWGQNGSGEVGTGNRMGQGSPVAVAGVSNAVRILAAPFVACAMDGTGRVLCWGDPHYTEGPPPTSTIVPLPITGLGSNIVSLGPHAPCALDASGQVSCWGPLPLATDLTVLGVQAIKGFDAVANISGYCAGTRAGEVLCFGYDKYGQLGDGTTLDSAVPVRALIP